MHSVPEVQQLTVHYFALQIWPGIHHGRVPSARTVVEPSAIKAKATNMRMRVFFTVFSFSRKTRFSSAVQGI
jgi:hypothetical protein